MRVRFFFQFAASTAAVFVADLHILDPVVYPAVIFLQVSNSITENVKLRVSVVTLIRACMLAAHAHTLASLKTPPMAHTSSFSLYL